MHTILVTGGTGFIGSAVAKKLAKKNIVRVYDLSLGQDIRDRKKLEKAMRGVDVVLHIAGLASNINSFSDPIADAEVNYLGTINVVNACILQKVPRLVYASSMMVNNPTSHYGISKFAGERFVHAHAHELAVTSLRMFNVYGPGQSITNPYQGVLAIFIGNVLRGEPIRIFGTGKQSRDFIYIDDVVDVWEKVMDNKKQYGKILEVGSGKATSIYTLARAVIAAAGKKEYPIRYERQRPGDMHISRAKTKTGRISLSVGLQRTIAFVKSSRIF